MLSATIESISPIKKTPTRTSFNVHSPNLLPSSKKRNYTNNVYNLLSFNVICLFLNYIIITLLCDNKMICVQCAPHNYKYEHA